MRRTILLTALVMLAAVSCKPASEQLVIKDWKVGQIENIGLAGSDVAAGLSVELDVENATRSTISIEDLTATLYKLKDGMRFADVVISEPVSVGPMTSEKVIIPLQLTLANPLALLIGGIDQDMSNYTADVDMTVRKGAFKKKIHEERIPLKELLDKVKNKPITDTK